jgi:hypothetical protein
MWVRVVVQSLLRLLRPRALTRPAAAASQLFINDLYGRTLSHRSIEQFTKKIRDNNYCVWLYNLIFV